MPRRSRHNGALAHHILISLSGVWDHVLIDKLLEIAVIIIFNAEYLPGFQEGWESRNLVHAVFPYTPSLAIDSMMLVQPHLF